MLLCWRWVFYQLRLLQYFMLCPTAFIIIVTIGFVPAYVTLYIYSIAIKVCFSVMFTSAKLNGAMWKCCTLLFCQHVWCRREFLSLVDIAVVYCLSHQLPHIFKSENFKWICDVAVMWHVKRKCCLMPFDLFGMPYIHYNIASMHEYTMR